MKNQGLGGFLAAWTAFIQKFALVVVLAAVGLCALAIDYTANNLAMNTSTSDMIDARTQFRQSNDAFERAFPQFSGLLVIVLDGPNPEAAQIAAAMMTEKLAAQTDLFKQVSYPEDDAFFKQNGLLFRDEAELAELADRLAGAAPMLAVLAERPDLTGLFEIFRLAATQGEATAGAQMAPILLRVAAIMDAQQRGVADDLSWRALLTGETSTRAIVVTRPRLDYGGMKPASDAIDAIHAAAAALGVTAEQGFRLRLTGSVALDHDELESVELGGKAAGLLSLTLVCVLLALGLRSLTLILASVATLIVGLIWTAAFTAIAIGHLNLISVAFAVLFVGLAVDFSLHYCLRFREALAAGDDHRAAIVAASRGCGASLTMSAVCAAAGFFAFLPTDYKGLAELGLISGVAMFIALFANLTLLPALLTLFGGRVSGLTLGRRRFDFARYYRPILFAALGVGVVAVLASTQLRFDFNPLNLKDAASESMTAFRDLALNPRTAPYSIDVLTPNLGAAAKEATRLSSLAGVGDVVTLHSLAPGGQDEKMVILEDMAFFLAPTILAPTTLAPDGVVPPTAQDRRAAFDTLHAAVLAQKAEPFAALATAMTAFSATESGLVALEARLTRYLPRMLAGLRLALSVEPFGLADIPDHLRRDWVTPEGVARVQLRPARPLLENDEIRDFAQTVLAAQPRASGAPVTISEAGRIVVGAFREATLTALALIALLLFAVLRRPGPVFLVLGPLALAAACTTAVSVLFDLPFNFANVIVLPLLLGLGVASGVHLVMRGKASAASSTPRAVLYSALTTLVSFGSLMVSGHKGMVSMGQLLTISIVFMLIAMLVVLPAQMAWRDKRGD